MRTALDDQEETEYLSRWSEKKLKRESEVLQVRAAHRDGSISLIEMLEQIARIYSKYRRMP